MAVKDVLRQKICLIVVLLESARIFDSRRVMAYVNGTAFAVAIRSNDELLCPEPEKSL